MSNYDLTWTEAQDEQARVFGWRLATTFDNGKKVPYFMVADAGKHGSDTKAARFVIQAAHGGHALSMHALRACAQSRVQRERSP